MTTEARAGAPPRYKRSIKNYLIDSRFQLKYTSFILIVALVISGVLGAFLWSTSQHVVDESQKLADESQRVVEESKKVSDVVKMSMKDDPIYGSDPELMKAFTGASSDNDAKIKAQEDAIIGHQRATVEQQRVMIYSLVGGLTAMVVMIGLLGIYFTHKVAGPIYKMKMLLKQVGEGKLNFQGRLRKGDELQDFFEAFNNMVAKLKDRQKSEVERLEQAIEMARSSGASEEAVAKIVIVRDEMKAALDV